MSASKLDAVYRSILLTKFFTKGWGKPENLRRLFEFRKVVSNRDECFKLVEKDYPVTITKDQNLTDCRLLEGYFVTPLERHLPGIVPEIAKKAHFQVLLPVHWPEPSCKPVCLHLAGTGDHFFWRRRNLMVKPLLKEAGIGGIILENPFYGLRKPTDQIRSSLHNVSDIFVMGGCLILESLVLFHWCERNGLGPLGVTGLSMGGHMASLAATNWPKPLVLVPCLSWSTASAVFLQGVMSQSINWDLLEDQYLSDGVYREKLSKMVTIVDEAFLAGKKFARTYSQTIVKINKPETVVNTTPHKNVDVTYREQNCAKDPNVIDITKNIAMNDKTPKANHKSEYSMQLAQLNEGLKKLLDEDKINKVLYDKLMSNEKFQLDSQDIEDINKLTEDRIKELLLKFKVGKSNWFQKFVRPDNRITDQLYLVTYRMVPATEITLIQNEMSNVSDVIYKDDAAKAETNSETSQKEVTQKTWEGSLKMEMPKTEEVVTDKIEVTTAKVDVTTEKVEVPKTKKTASRWNMSELTSDFWVNLPFIRSSGKKIDINKIHWRDREALQFMRGIMDECTHLSNFSVPFDTSLIIAVCAEHDAYVPREDVGRLEEIWPGAEVRYVDAGHVSAYILHQSMFRACIREAFERSKKRWKDGNHIN